MTASTAKDNRVSGGATGPSGRIRSVNGAARSPAAHGMA